MENRPYSIPGSAGSSDVAAPPPGSAPPQPPPVLQQIPQQAGRLLDQVRDQMKSRASGQKEQATGGLATIAQALRQTGQQLQEQSQTTVGQFADRAAEPVETLAGYLRDRNVDQLIGEAEGFARRQPALFLGGAFVLGLLSARFLKSSAPSAAPDAGDGTSLSPYLGTSPRSAWTPTNGGNA